MCLCVDVGHRQEGAAIMSGISSIRSNVDPWLAGTVATVDNSGKTTDRNVAAREKTAETAEWTASATSPTTIRTDTAAKESRNAAAVEVGTQRDLLGVMNARLAVSADGDTLEISRASMEQAMTMGVPGGAMGTQGSAMAMPGGVAGPSGSAPAGGVQGTTTEEEEEDGDNTDLSSYSELQLAQLLADGTISSAQYIAELKRREMVETAEVTGMTEPTGTAATVGTR